LLVMAPEFMVTVWGEGFRESSAVFRVYLLLLPIRTFSIGAIGLAAGKTKELALVSVVALLANVILNAVAINLFGVVGCAIATVLVIYFVNWLGGAIIALRVLECKLQDFVPWRKMSALIGTSCLALPVVFLLKMCLSLGDVAMLCTTFVAYTSLTLWLLIRNEFIDRNIFQKLRQRYV